VGRKSWYVIAKRVPYIKKEKAAETGGLESRGRSRGTEKTRREKKGHIENQRKHQLTGGVSVRTRPDKRRQHSQYITQGQGQFAENDGRSEKLLRRRASWTILGMGRVVITPAWKKQRSPKADQKPPPKGGRGLASPGGKNFFAAIRSSEYQAGRSPEGARKGQERVNRISSRLHEGRKVEI